MGLERKFFLGIIFDDMAFKSRDFVWWNFFHVSSESSFYVALISLLIVESEVENF